MDKHQHDGDVDVANVRYMPPSSKGGTGHAVTARGCCGVCVCLRWASEFCMCVAVGAVCVVRALFFLLTCIYLYVLYLYILKGGFIYMSGNV